jgi:hypothetical protein
LIDGKKLKASDLRHYEDCIDQLQISGKATKVFKDEQEEGDERPDLDFMIGGKKIGGKKL